MQLLYDVLMKQQNQISELLKTTTSSDTLRKDVEETQRAAMDQMQLMGLNPGQVGEIHGGGLCNRFSSHAGSMYMNSRAWTCIYPWCTGPDAIRLQICRRATGAGWTRDSWLGGCAGSVGGRRGGVACRLACFHHDQI